MNKPTIEILIDALSDHDWAQLQLKAGARRAFQKAEVYKARRESAIEFGDWILKQNVTIGYDMDGISCWVVPDGKGNTYSTDELYTIWYTDAWEEIDDEDEQLR